MKFHTDEENLSLVDKIQLVIALKLWEWAYLLCEPFISTLYRVVRRTLRKITKNYATTPLLLDAGGRSSSYTTGLNAIVTISDLPRVTSIQKGLSLGLSLTLISAIRRNRSNVKEILYDDMTDSNLSDTSFDCVTAIEVLEHVSKDQLFIKAVHRVLKKDGVFIMTTPNGEYVVNTNPDHIRHYSRAQLQKLLKTTFSDVDVFYAVKGGVLYNLGLAQWTLKNPFRTLISMACNLLNNFQFLQPQLRYQNKGTMHLIGLAWKH